MSDDTTLGQPWRRPIARRDPGEEHRQASYLELFFDLCFVVAVASGAASLHHALAEGHVASGIVSYLLVFFAIWWGWMSFTWFASGYDVDDVPYRLCVFMQIAGALVLAAGVPRAFERTDLSLIFFGYLVMRLGLIAQRLRVAYADDSSRATMLRYALGEGGAMLGWAVVIFVLPDSLVIPGFVVMAATELAIPVWAERTRPTPWHPHHIAERYGLFTIIVLGESVLAATIAVQSALAADEGFEGVATVIVGGLLVMFSMWTLYFARSAHRFLTSNRIGFVWGYGHYVIFASGAAVGAGLALGVDHATGHSHLRDAVAAAAVTVPVALFLVTLWFLHIRPQRIGVAPALLYLLAAAAVVGVTFTPWPVLAAGVVTALLAAVLAVLSDREYRRAAVTA